MYVVDILSFTVLKPLSAECHVIMDQSSDIVLDTPKVNELACVKETQESTLRVTKNLEKETVKHWSKPTLLS